MTQLVFSEMFVFIIPNLIFFYIYIWNSSAKTDVHFNKNQYVGETLIKIVKDSTCKYCIDEFMLVS